MTIYKTRQEIANEYGVSRITLFRKLRDRGVKLPKTLLNNYHIQLIYNALGPPQRNLSQDHILEQKTSSNKQDETN
ncbi:MAG TPA: hypothetical protein P5275_17210 [Saprospiraceae bacterium]|nr:hypothetical protein [Saprospiraceae bacterium]MCB9270896.1 hypothetical protein [Lewinellaceae bacterium]HPG09446.1 hypothetical protein [Saprospiraceae bacterium]HPQ99757.1 hypothetical protein [Saprospiraceae bacterium]HRV86617.1 hypothetical protein [Saprospiraceae bacterium]